MSDDYADVEASLLTRHSQWQAQYKQIILWGKQLTPKPFIRVDEYRVSGCEVPVWIRLRVENESCYVDIDVDSLVIGGLALLVASGIHGRSLTTIDSTQLREGLTALGLQKHLTPSRNNGVKAIIDRLEQLLADAMQSNTAQ